MFLTAKIKLIIASVLIGILLLGSYTYYIYRQGRMAVQNEQATEQLKTEITVRKKYEKVDKKTPYNAGKRESLDWLYKFGRK